MNELLVLNPCDDLTKIADVWNRLRATHSHFVPYFDDLTFFVSTSQRDFRILVIRNNDQIISLACFIYQRTMKPFKIGERMLFRLPIKEVSLFGSAILGYVDDAILDSFLDVVKATFNFDLIYFGYLPINSALYKAILSGTHGLFITTPSPKQSIRWLINMPHSFNEYLTCLSSTTRQSIRRKMRKAEHQLQWTFSVISKLEQVEFFLRDAETISRLTYQWNVGDRLYNDEATRLLYAHRARRGRLRCYIAHSAGIPCAFLRGELVDDLYYYETPGFDPQFSKFSPGLVLLMWAIRDLIEQTNCSLFDFGSGGDALGYKSTFGNLSFACSDVEIGRWGKPYSVAIMALQGGLNLAKILANQTLGQGTIRRRAKKAIRKYGD